MFGSCSEALRGGRHADDLHQAVQKGRSNQRRTVLRAQISAEPNQSSWLRSVELTEDYPADDSGQVYETMWGRLNEMCLLPGRFSWDVTAAALRDPRMMLRSCSLGSGIRRSAAAPSRGEAPQAFRRALTGFEESDAT